MFLTWYEDRSNDQHPPLCVLHPEHWKDFLILIRLQTSQSDFHSDNILLHQMCVGHLRSLHTPLGNVKKSFSASSLATKVVSPKPQFHLQELCHHQLTGRESLCAASHWGNDSSTSHQPPEEDKQERFLPPQSVSLSLAAGFCYPGLWLVHPDSYFFLDKSLSHTVQPALSKSSPGWHIALFSGLLRAWLHALFIPQADSFHQRRRN